MPFGESDLFVVEPSKAKANVWAVPVSMPVPEWRNDDSKKKAFGEALGKLQKPFEAACEVFGDDTNAALWASCNWLNDPIVIAARDEQALILGQKSKTLDKDGFALTVLEAVNDPIYEGKDKIALLRLYAEVKGYIGKALIDQSVNNISNRTMKVVFVRPDSDVKTIDQVPATKHIEPVKSTGLRVKLVG